MCVSPLFRIMTKTLKGKDFFWFILLGVSVLFASELVVKQNTIGRGDPMWESKPAYIPAEETRTR